MNSETEPREQFLKAESTVGITKQNFARRFLFSPTNSNDNYLLDRLTITPSQLQGFTIDQEKCISNLMSELIFRAGESLKLPVSTTVVAASIAHYFYSRVGHLDYDFRDVVMGALFLACKSEQTLRKSFEIAAVFDYVFKIFEGQRMPIRILVLNSNEYDFMRAKVLKMENEILFELGFEVHRLFDIPHRYIGGLFKSFERHPKSKEICQKAWVFLNDFYRTNSCLHYPGQTIAAAAVHMSLLKLKIKMPTVPWWILLQSNLQSIQELICELESFYEVSNACKYTLQWVSAQINEVGEKHGYINVFPVNYYRKIILEQNKQLKILKVVTPQREIKVEPLIQVQHEMKEESAEISSEHKKHKKEKSKKEKKDRKKKKERQKRKQSGEGSGSHSRSRSRDKSRESRSDSYPPPKIRNNDETPKVLKPELSFNNIVQMEQKPTIETKQVVKQMKVESTKGLLSMVSSQLKKHQIRKQKQQQAAKDSDDQLMAELIKIKKSKTPKSTEGPQ